PPHEQASARSVPPPGGGAHRSIACRKRSVPGGASGLQIRERPRAGLWWVRLPLSSATFPEQRMSAAFLDDLQAAARTAQAAETPFRREVATRIAALEQARAFAFRRVNLMKTIAEVVAAAESQDMAVAHALATLRSRLGWDADSEARAAVLTRFASVTQAVF